MKKRFAFKCWNCNRKYTLFKVITEEQELIVACPYCHAEGVVKLGTIPKKMIILKGAGDEAASPGFEYDFPEVIPTQKPDQP